jgi:hypothetical protein
MSEPEKPDFFPLGAVLIAVDNSLCLLFLDDMVQCSMDLHKNKMKKKQNRNPAKICRYFPVKAHKSLKQASLEHD